MAIHSETDANFIDVTGLPEIPIPAELLTPTAPPPVPYYAYHPSYHAYSLLGDWYEQKLGLQRKEVTWLNKFYAPTHAFMQIEVAREATVRLFVAVMNELEVWCQQAGSTLLKRVKELEEETQEHTYNYYDYRYVSRNSAGHKVGAAIFLTIFQRCENAVRERFDFRLLDADVYFSERSDPERLFNQYFGDVAQAMLPDLAHALPPPAIELEQALNQADQARWQPRFEQLLARLPADPPGFVAGVYALGHENARNPVIGTLYYDALRRLGERAGEPPIRDSILGLYLHYLYYGSRKYNFRSKPLLKRLQKKLFPKPEHLERFEALSQQLLKRKDLPQALEQVSAIYYQERRKIELDPAAVQTARARHAGTVELLNEYLQDEPTPADTPPAALAPKAAPTKALKPAARTAPKTAAPKAPKAKPPQAEAASAFASRLALNATQQELLLLFTARKLTLPRVEAEAFAQRHGALRNQLIDGLNEACYELLDDVLIEESGEDYAIYPPYYQKLVH